MSDLETAARAALNALSAMVRACAELRQIASPDFTAANGKRVRIEAPDGERCWIVHDDGMVMLSAAEHASVATIAALEAALKAALAAPGVDPAAIRRAALEEAITAIRDARPMPHNLMSVQYAQDIIRALADEQAKTEADRDLFTPKGLIEVIRRIRKEAAYGQTNEFVFALDVFASRMQDWVEKRGRYFSEKEPTDG